MTFIENFKLASKDEDIQKIKLLIIGQDVNARDVDGLTPLCFIDKTEIAEMLLDLGADVNSKSNKGLTPLHFADNIETIKLLIERGANVNSRAFMGVTPLHSATMYGDIEIAKILILNGADINAKDDCERTPLDIAVIKSNTEMITFLQSEIRIEKIAKEVMHFPLNKLENYISEIQKINERAINLLDNEPHSTTPATLAIIIGIMTSQLYLDNEYAFAPNTFEVLVCSSLFILGEMKNQLPNNYPQFQKEYFNELELYAKKHNVLNLIECNLSTFIKARFEFYGNEFALLLQQTNALPTKITYFFYEAPLALISSDSNDIMKSMELRIKILEVINSDLIGRSVKNLILTLDL